MSQEAELIYTTDTTMQAEPVDFQTLHRLSRKEKLPETPERTFIYHTPYGHFVIGIVAGNEIGVELTEAELGLPGDVVVFSASQSAQWQDPEDESEEVPDVFTPSYERRVLFSKPIEIQAGTLRRWKPHITIDHDMVSEEEDD
jgi:hypothetical protein